MGRKLPHALASFALLASPAQAEFAGWITGCSAGPIGADQCPAADVGEFMGSLPIGYLDDFRALGMESYAMEDALRRVGGAISAKASGGGCDDANEALLAAAIWSDKVELSSSADKVEVALFGHLENILENGIAYAGGDC